MAIGPVQLIVLGFRARRRSYELIADSFGLGTSAGDVARSLPGSAKTSG